MGKRTVQVTKALKRRKEATNMNRIQNYRTAARLALETAMAILALPMVSHAATYSYTDLNPSGLEYSLGYGISSGQQVGNGYAAGDQGYHALLWSGTSGSMVDLNPS